MWGGLDDFGGSVCNPYEFAFVGGREQVIETGSTVQQDGLGNAPYRSKKRGKTTKSALSLRMI